MSGRWLRLPCDPSIYDINSCFRAAYQHEWFSVLICVVANAREMTLPFLAIGPQQVFGGVSYGEAGRKFIQYMLIYPVNWTRLQRFSSQGGNYPLV